MKNRLFSGILFALLGLLIAVGPQTLFSVCPVGDVPMKCYYTARAEIGIGALITLESILLLLFPKTQVRIGLNLAIIFDGLLVLLIPNVLIGVCSGVHMRCHELTLPALTILGGIVIIASIINVIYLFLSEKRRHRENAG